jgi:uncharacterized protein
MSDPALRLSTCLVALTAQDIAAVVIAFRDALTVNQAALNRLNVYPVPDGDTGTNMALTMTSVVAELQNLENGGADEAAAAHADKGGQSLSDLTMAAVCGAISHGALMGARGNSGVILSQILRGMAVRFRDQNTVGPNEFAEALANASTAAYSAVMKPIEGTILTVARCASEGANDSLSPGASLLDVVDGARRQAAIGLAQTPDLLPVLKAAGVVDSGGSGYLLLLDAALHVIDGRTVPVMDVGIGPDTMAFVGGSSGQLVGASGSKDVSELRYEVMYLLEAEDARIGGFKEAWSAIGDSIVVVGGEGLWNCHIHTDDIGSAIEAAIDIGRPRKIRVTDLLDEVHEIEEERWVREATGDAIVDQPPHVDVPVETAMVVVSSGDGIRRLFWSLGVQQVVTGGQSMNPSTAQLLDAVNACPASSVLILPNNKNIIAVAEQVASLTQKSVRVIATKGVAEGLAAAMQYDPSGALDENASAMRAAAATVVSGEITQAVRDSTCDVGPIAEGDWLGIARDDGIVAVASGLSDAVSRLLDQLVVDHHEIVTVIEGEGSSAADTRRITEWLADHRPGVVAEVHAGGQPLYPYLFGVE